MFRLTNLFKPRTLGSYPSRLQTRLHQSHLNSSLVKRIPQLTSNRNNILYNRSNIASAEIFPSGAFFGFHTTTKTKKFVPFPRLSCSINQPRAFHTTSVSLIPVLPIVLFSIPLSIPYFLLLRLLAIRLFSPPTLSKITRTFLSLFLSVPVVYILAADSAPNTNRHRYMLLWPWEEQKLADTARKCVQEVLTSSSVIPPTDDRARLVDHVSKRLWNEGAIMMDVPHSGIEIKEPTVYLVSDDDVLDGIAYPSSEITLTTGWLRLIDYDENLLAAVIAHEIAHILQNHAAEFYGMSFVEKIIVRLREITQTFIPKWLLSKQDDIQSQWPSLFLQRYSQILEREADLLGQEIMSRAGYDPAHAIELWQLLVELEKISNEKTTSFQEDNGHGVRHNSQIKMHPPRQQRVKYLTENLVQVQRIYDYSSKDGARETFEPDLKLKKLETTIWAIFDFC